TDWPLWHWPNKDYHLTRTVDGIQMTILINYSRHVIKLRKSAGQEVVYEVPKNELLSRMKDSLLVCVNYVKPFNLKLDHIIQQEIAKSTCDLLLYNLYGFTR